MIRFGLFYTLLFCLNTPIVWASYTLADLEVLTQEGNYQEFFSHALDVRPSERQEPWKGMVSKMADAYGRQILTDAEITKAQFNGNERILAIRKDAQINTKPEIKNYDGKVIPFKETQNFYYIYFYPMTTTTWDDNTAYNGILFYKGKALNNSAKSSNLHSRRSLDQNRVVIMEINATTDFGIKTKSYNNDSFF